jgi:putative ABC transport system ATP-binding protein
MSPPAIDLEQVEFSWSPGVHVLSIEKLTVAAGERVFIKGASGSGKSTLLALIGGVLVPQTGSIRVLGEPIHRLRASRRDRFRAEHIGFIFQMFNLIPYLSVEKNVLLPLEFSSTRRQRLGGLAPRDEAQRLLRALGLTDPRLIERPVTQLSIGQQQRVAAARALLGRPQIVIADEPTSSLDADARSDFLRLLMSECSAHGTTLLFVSHDSALGPLFDRTIHLSDLNGADHRGHPVAGAA